MRGLALGVVLAVTTVVASDGSVVRAQSDGVRAQIARVIDASPDTPGQLGLLPTAIAEAEVAIAHADLTAKAPDLITMQLHAGHVINAIDPVLEPKGPGLGFGVKKAAAAVASLMDLASAAAGVAPGAQTEAVYASAWTVNVLRWADETVDVAQRIRSSTSVKQAAILTGDLTTVTRKLIDGVPAVGREGAQGGLHQAVERVENMKRAADL